MDHISFFQCIICKQIYNIKEIRYRCECGDLLEVKHNIKKSIPNPKQWKNSLDKNLNISAFHRYHSIILPSLPIDKIITLNEGDTPLYDVSHIFPFFKSIKLKHEGMNPTLSFKDRGMVAGISWANYLGCKNVICASTGDTSAAMAAYAGSAPNMNGIVLLPDRKISPEQLAQPISSGAKTIGIKTDFDGCMKLVQQITQKHSIYLLNSMNSIRIEGQKAIVIETLHQLSWKVPDWFIIPVGNAGNISALGKGLKELYEIGIINKLPKIAGIQTMQASPMYTSFKNNFSNLVPQKAKPTKASAIQIGNPVSYKKAVNEIKYFNGLIEAVSEKEIMDSKAQVDRIGISICPNSAVAVAGAMKLKDNCIIGKNDNIVIILTAHGNKFSNTSIEYHQNPSNNYSNKTTIIEPELSQLEQAIVL